MSAKRPLTVDQIPPTKKRCADVPAPTSEPVVVIDLTKVTRRGKKRSNKKKRVAVSVASGILGPHVLDSSCAFSAMNNLVTWTHRPALPLQMFWDALDSMKQSANNPRDKNELGYYSVDEPQKMRLHWSVLMRMISLTKDFKMTKCQNTQGNWDSAKSICKQKDGLFLLFGYVDDTIEGGHYVAMNATTNVIIDPLNPQTLFDVSAKSLKTIFAANRNTGNKSSYGAFDCAFKFELK